MNKEIFCRISCLLLLSFVICTLHAQRNMRYGVKIGTNYSLFTGPDKPSMSITPWLLDAGGYMEYAISDFSSVWIEPGYVQRGVKIIKPLPYLDGSEIKIFEKNNYITVPIFFKIRHGDDFLNSYVGVGTEFEILVQQRREMKARIYNLQVDPLNYYNYTPNFLNYGFTGAIGVNVMGVMVAGKFYTGLVNLYRERDAPEIRYNTFTINITYQMNRPRMTKYTNGRNVSIKNKLRYTYIRIRRALPF